jgi:hypothetical protein
VGVHHLHLELFIASLTRPQRIAKRFLTPFPAQLDKIKVVDSPIFPPGYNSGMDATEPTKPRLRRWLFVVLFAVGLFSVQAGWALWPVVRQHFREEQKRQQCVDKIRELSDALSKAKARKAIEAENRDKPAP